jgi:hypothetical protein
MVCIPYSLGLMNDRVPTLFFLKRRQSRLSRMNPKASAKGIMQPLNGAAF